MANRYDSKENNEKKIETGTNSELSIKPELSYREIFDMLAILFTISGALWGIIYAALEKLKYVHSLRESLAAFIIIFILILILMKYRKRSSLANN